MAGIGHRHRPVVLVASPGASLVTARRGASSSTGAGALWLKIMISRFSMRRQSARPPKKRGPPATGKGKPILVRLQPAQLAALDAWIARQDARLSRPEAIRRLVEQALAGSQPRKSPKS
jgi:hypothetical protein